MTYVNENKYFKDTINEELGKLGYKELVDENSSNNIYFCDIDYNNRKDQNYEKCQIVNQLENVNPLGNKKDQYNIHMDYFKERPEYMPYTMSFRKDKLKEVDKLLGQFNKAYIVKPENDSFRNGCGIVRNREELRNHLDEFEMYDDWIIQDYIDDPLLINNRKFHFRIYVIYIQSSEWQAAYLSRVGFIYTANKPFQKGTFDLDVVLSGESSPSNVYYVPEDFHKNFGKDKWDNLVLPQIVKITRETLMSTIDRLKCPNSKQKCFKILGYDILINKDYQLYLAEINARGVTYKYPNEQFLDSFYRNILKLVLPREPLNNAELKDQNLPYERILYKKNGALTEHFANPDSVVDESKIDNNIKFNNFYWKLVYPFMILVFVLILIQLFVK